MRTFEILLVEVILFIALWLWDEYVAFVLTIIIPSILFFILIVSLISEKLERSKVPRAYFTTMFFAIFPPIIIAMAYIFISGGQMNWLIE